MKYPELESDILEFKSEIPKNNQIIKTIVAFSNQNGGKLIIGVANNGEIVGIDDDTMFELMEYLPKSIYEACNPPILAQVYGQKICDKNILIIEVSPGSMKPYYVKSEGLNDGVYIRIGRSTAKATSEMLDELKWKSRGISFDSLPVYQGKITDLDLDYAKDFFGIPNGKNGETLESFLRSFGVIAEQHYKEYPTYAGILTFGYEPQKFLPYTYVICSHFAGISGRDTLATIESSGTLSEQFWRAYHFIISRLNKAFVIESSLRNEILEIPEIAIREALINAIAHRNYHDPAPIKIAIFDDRIEIFSPGGFPKPINTDKICSGIMYIRNHAIVKILRRAKLMENFGTGLAKIIESYEQRGLSCPKFINDGSHVKVILPRSTVAQDFKTLEKLKGN